MRHFRKEWGDTSTMHQGMKTNVMPTLKKSSWTTSQPWSYLPGGLLTPGKK